MKKYRLIMVCSGNNNNKFWYADVDGCTVYRKWGRVGVSEQSKTFTYSTPQLAIRETEKCANSKYRKGYTDLDLVESESQTVFNLEDVAIRDIETDSEKSTIDIIRYFAKANIHTITANSNVTISASGQIQTPLGVIGQQSIDRARVLLQKISTFVKRNLQNNSRFNELVDSYLSLIPMRVEIKSNPAEVFCNIKVVKQQFDLLDAMESYVTTATQITERVFNTKFTKVTDKQVLQKIQQLFKKTANRNHKSYGMRIKTVYQIEIADLETKFKSNIGNVMQLWHGTKASNILSILRNGLVIVPSGASFTTGRMFGDGLYFSDQSTKSLNYATNYWGGKDEGRYFMFICDVAMGKPYTPKSHRESFPKRGYNSTFAKADVSNVTNNEMIVYNINQHNIKYLVEFENGR